MPQANLSETKSRMPRGFRSDELVRYCDPLLLPDVKTESVLYLRTLRKIDSPG